MRELERDRNRNERVLPALAVVGAGRLGGALARAASDNDVEVSLAGREDAPAACQASGVAILCVPDTAIPAACEAISNSIPPLRYVGHTSGATGLTALGAAAERGAATFTLHPLQTVPDAAAELAGAGCAISGSTPDALEMARSLAARLGMRPFELPEDGRVAYHAAASVASNFLVALEEAAAELLERTGVENGRELLTPLVLRSAENWSRRGREALTGPIARGDEETVKRHLEEIADRHPELLEAYRALAELTRKLARGEEVAA